jgi:hypothetical protein
MANPFAAKKRREFAQHIAKLLAPTDSGKLLAALHEAITPHLHDIPDKAFSLANAEFVAQRCSGAPGTDEIRRILLEALADKPKITPLANHRSTDAGPLPDWLLQKILQNVGYHPGSELRAWLIAKGVTPDAWLGRDPVSGKLAEE